jgi:hypothetical protein
MALEERFIERLKAERSTLERPPRAITGALQQTVFPSLEKRKAKPVPQSPPMLPQFTEPQPTAPVEPAPAPAEPPNPFDQYVEANRSGW